MARTLAQIVAQAMGEIGLPAPSPIVSNDDGTAIQALALLNREGAELIDLPGGWPALVRLQTIALAAGQSGYDLPADLLYYSEGTFWSGDSKWPVVGPVDDIEWQRLKAGLAAATPRLRYRLIGAQIHFHPVPTAPGTVTIEYASTSWVKPKDGDRRPMFAADDDLPLLPDDLLVLGLKWRFLAARGLNYAEERVAYDRAVERKRPRAATSPVLMLNRRARRGWGDPLAVGDLHVDAG